MSKVQELQAARAAIEQVQKELETTGKEVLVDIVTKLFSVHGFKNIQWAAKTSEYNDEGMYPGIAGPVADEDESDRWADWVYDYSPTVDPRLTELKDALDALGEDILVELFGDTMKVIARPNGRGSVKFEVEDMGY